MKILTWLKIVYGWLDNSSPDYVSETEQIAWSKLPIPEDEVALREELDRIYRIYGEPIKVLRIRQLMVEETLDRITLANEPRNGVYIVGYNTSLVEAPITGTVDDPELPNTETSISGDRNDPEMGR